MIRPSRSSSCAARMPTKGSFSAKEHGKETLLRDAQMLRAVPRAARGTRLDMTIRHCGGLVAAGRENRFCGEVLAYQSALSWMLPWMLPWVTSRWLFNNTGD